jgi:hypothetical protein
MSDFLFSTCHLQLFLWTALSKSLIPNIESGGGTRIDRHKEPYAASRDRRLWRKWRGLALWLVAILN